MLQIDLCYAKIIDSRILDDYRYIMLKTATQVTKIGLSNTHQARSMNQSISATIYIVLLAIFATICIVWLVISAFCKTGVLRATIMYTWSSLHYLYLYWSNHNNMYCRSMHASFARHLKLHTAHYNATTADILLNAVHIYDLQ